MSLQGAPPRKTCPCALEDHSQGLGHNRPPSPGPAKLGKFLSNHLPNIMDTMLHNSMPDYTILHYMYSIAWGMQITNSRS